ncbi:MAG: hypothetical protein ACYDC3_06520 [Candidatus Binataceae bacterium]
MVAELVARYLPRIQFSLGELRMLPREVAGLSGELLDHVAGKDALPPGFEPSGDR